MRALRERFPRAHLAAYVNSYNLPVLEGNPDLDAAYAYTKAKHAGADVLRQYLARAKLLWSLRGQRFDDVIIAEPVVSPKLVRLATFLKPRRIIGFVDAHGAAIGITDGVPRGSPEEVARLHEVEDVFRLAGVYGIEGPPPAVRVSSPVTPASGAPVIGLHLSARKPSQRWPEAAWIDLARCLHESHGAAIRVFWAPGAEAHPQHPGDDEKAARVMAALRGLPATAVPTTTLRALIDGLAACTAVICSDGGAMHLAAGLGKPIVCLFGKSDAVRWHPWGVPYELLQPSSMEVGDASVEAVLAAYARLLQVPEIQGQNVTNP